MPDWLAASTHACIACSVLVFGSWDIQACLFDYLHGGVESLGDLIEFKGI
jgi:hypothetical protein